MKVFGLLLAAVVAVLLLSESRSQEIPDKRSDNDNTEFQFEQEELSDWIKSPSRHDSFGTQTDRIPVDPSLFSALTAQYNPDAHDESVTRIETRIVLTGLDVEDSGKWAVVWGSRNQPETGPDPRVQRPSVTADSVAVVDLKRGQVVARKTIRAGVKSALVDTEYVWLLANSGKLIYRLRLSDLEGENRTLLQETAGSMFRFPGGKLGIVEESQNQISIRTLDRNKLQMVGAKLMCDARHGPVPYEMPYCRISNDQMALPRKIANVKTGETELLTVAMFHPLTTDRRTFPTPDYVIRDNFGRFAMGALRVRSTHRPIGDHGPWFLSPHVPLAFSIKTTADGYQHLPASKRLKKVFLGFHSLEDGSEIQSILIDTVQQSTSFSMTSLFAIPNEEAILIGLGSQLLVIEPPQEALAIAPMPLHLSWPKCDLLTVDKPATVSLAATGGEGKLVFGLFRNAPDLNVNGATGELTIDIPFLWKSYLDETYSTANPEITSMVRSMQKELVRPRMKEDYEQLMGHALPQGRVPFSFPVEVGVSDEAGNEDRILFHPIVLAPESEIVQRIKEISQALKRQAQSRQNENQTPPSWTQFGGNNNTQVANSGNQRTSLEDLERRLRRAEGALDSVVERVNEAIENRRKTP